MTTTRKETLRNIMVEAWQFVRRNGFTMAEAMKEAWLNYKNRVALKAGVSEFWFRKVNGDLRQAFGTLASGKIPATKGSRHQYAGTQVYFDLEKNEWRCYKTCNLMKVGRMA